MIMNILYISANACKRIVEEKEPVKKVLASFDIQYNFSAAQKTRMQRLIRGTLRNYVSLKYEILAEDEHFKTTNKKIYLYLCTLFSIRKLIKLGSEEELKDEFKDAVNQDKLNVDVEETYNKLLEMGRVKFVVPEKEKKNAIKYNSLLFSVPEWIINIWLKQFGQDVTVKLLRSIDKKSHLFVRRNELLISERKFGKNKDFNSVRGVKGAYEYQLRSSLNKNEFKKLGYCFRDDLTFQDMLNSYTLPAGSKALLLNGEKTELTCDLAIRLQAARGDLIVNIEDDRKYRKGLYTYDKLGIKNISCYHANMDLLRTYLGYNTFDLVVVMPKNTRFGLVNYKPELLASIKKQDYRRLKDYQLECLEEAAKYIKSDGTFIYCVETINKREGEDIVNLFLERHSGFEIVASHQYLPYEKQTNGMYYAMLRRNYDR